MEDLGSSHGLALRGEVFVAGLFGGQSRLAGLVN